MAVFLDEIVRVGLPQIRAQFPPRRFRALTSVRLAHGPDSCIVRIVRKFARGCVTMKRAWLRCPNPTCGRLASVVGHAYGSWGCRVCLGWRARPRPSSGARAPHVTSASIDGEIDDAG